MKVRPEKTNIASAFQILNERVHTFHVRESQKDLFLFLRHSIKG